MITAIAQIALLVHDYDEALVYYRDQLGFKVVENTDLGSKRWIRVAPPGGGAELVLSRASDERQRAAVGNQAGGRVLLFLRTDDCHAAYESLRTRGVVFTEAPRREAYGTVAVFQDLYGNRFDLIGPR